jgi:hypothetical protein
MRKIDWSAPRGVPGADGPGLRFGFRKVIFPSWFLCEMAAKSFVSTKGVKFYFSRPHKLFRRAVFAGCRRASTGVGLLGRVSIAVTRCWGLERLLRKATPMFQGTPSRHDRRAALSSQRTSVRLYPWRYLICYLYRCKLERASLFFFGELEGPSCSQRKARWHG